MQSHVDEFERLQPEIEFHSGSMKPEDINIAFLLSLGDSEMWKNFRNSNLHRATKLKPSDLFAEVILIDDANVAPSHPLDQARALSASFKLKRPSFIPHNMCEGCGPQGHLVEVYPKLCRFCREHGHVIEDCFKRR